MQDQTHLIDGCPVGASIEQAAERSEVIGGSCDMQRGAPLLVGRFQVRRSCDEMLHGHISQSHDALVAAARGCVMQWGIACLQPLPHHLSEGWLIYHLWACMEATLDPMGGSTHSHILQEDNTPDITE